MIVGFILFTVSITFFLLSLKVFFLDPKKYAFNYAKIKALRSDPTGEVDMQSAKRCFSIDTRNGEIITTKKAIVDTY